MNELRDQIEILSRQIDEKASEIDALKRELHLLKVKFNDLVDQQQREQRLKEEKLVAEQKALDDARSAKERRAAEELEKQQEPAQEEPVVNEAPYNDEPEVEHIGESEHQAIMRTIEELSKSFGSNARTSTAETFEARPTLSDKVSRLRLNDIRRGLGINERFLYANELFGGDMEAFSRAIEELNHVESETAAERLINENIASKYRWDQENETVIAFKSLVSRRFA
ncbi:MAG: hypothetical protein R2813_05725 [Flavobacteriales bacterium]